MAKYYSIEQINHEFNQLDPNAKVTTLYESLGFMQQHNSRSKAVCIALAMGYKNDQGLRDTYYKPSEDRNEKMESFKRKHSI